MYAGKLNRLGGYFVIATGHIGDGAEHVDVAAGHISDGAEHIDVAAGHISDGTEHFIAGTEHCSVPTVTAVDPVSPQTPAHDMSIKRYGKLSGIIKSFKNALTKRIRGTDMDNFRWQRGVRGY